VCVCARARACVCMGGGKGLNIKVSMGQEFLLVFHHISEIHCLAIADLKNTKF